MLENLPQKCTKFSLNFSNFRELENESSHYDFESWDREWDDSFPWESQFRDQDESLVEVCDMYTLR